MHIIFLVDATGSMGAYCQSVGSTAQQMFAVLDVLFEGSANVDIVTYEDYCDGERVIRTTPQGASQDELISFASGLKAGGGGDTPEAVKTGLNHIVGLLTQYNESDSGASGRTIIIHYTDAPPHHAACGSSAANIKAEQKALNGKVPGFDWVNICVALQGLSVQVVTFIPGGKLQHVSQFMSMLGAVVILPATSPTSITEHTMGFLLQIMGQPFRPLSCLRHQLPGLSDETCDKFKAALDKSLDKEDHVFQPHPSFVKDLRLLISQFEKSEAFQDCVYNALKSLLVPDKVLALTYNNILGLLWRVVCRRREDPRTQPMCDALSSCVQAMQGEDQSKLRAWVDESYNQLDEILEIIAAVSEPLLEVVLALDVNADDMPTKEELRSILHAPTPGVLKKVQSLLARLFVVTTGVLPVRDENIPMYLPLAMNDKDLLGALSHLISPGLLLSLRPTAMIAILAYLSNNPVLRPRAERFLTAWRGKWIPAVEKAEEYPEILNAEFVRLVVRVPEFLTEQEHSLYSHLNLINRVRRAATYRLHVKIGFTPSMEKLTPDKKMLCSSCGHRRSFTLMKDGICGLCLCNPEAAKEAAEPKCDEDCSHMVECRTCQALYAVVRIQDMNVEPKCHYCRNKETAPVVECVSCSNKYCSPTELHAGQTFVCSLCAKSPEEALPPREVRLVDLMAKNEDLLCCLGLLPAARALVFVRMGLFKLWTKHADTLAAGPNFAVEHLCWERKAVKEVPALIQVLRDAVHHGRLAETCSLCFEGKALPALQSACGLCSNLTCAACLKHWYGQLAPGRLYVPSEGLCPFCKQTPKAQTLRTFNRAACRLQGRKALDLRADMYYGWCQSCFKVKEFAPRECAQEAPAVGNFECEGCHLERLAATTSMGEALAAAAKQCPGCQSPSVKISGCNHITCPVCSIHWCWQCINQFASDDIYNHMEEAHGNIGLGGDGDFDND